MLSRFIAAVRGNAIARVLILVAIVFATTYGAMAIASVAMGTPSPLVVIPSSSMVPTLNIGDIVLVRGVDPKTITVGTIIIFRSPTSSIDIIHRVVEIVQVDDTLYFVTQGDNRLTNPSPDPYSPGVPEGNVKGVFAGKIPYLGYTTLALSGPLGIALIAFLIFLMIVFEYYDSRKKAQQETRPTK